MTRQKSENHIVPKGGVMPAPTRRLERLGGGKVVPVNEVARQLELTFVTAESPKGVVDGVEEDRSSPAPLAVPKAVVKSEKSQPAMMEEIAERLTKALHKVVSNKGAPGPDGQTVVQLREQWEFVCPKLAASLLNGKYFPGEIRRKNIPKSGGGERKLGIPNVVDRVVQESIRQVLEPLYEPTFHSSSHGFRPNRSCHTAVTEALRYLEDGYEVVVDLDLEKFFDQVCHQRLMARLAQRVTDHRLLVLIGQLLKAKVLMPDGVVVTTEEGVPQGGPLSPLLSNIVLDELDWELDQRGHRFCRYADDVTIFVRSERAGQRVMTSIRRYIERRLRLKVNAKKSAVARSGDRHFLGFSLLVDQQEGDVEVLLSERTKERAMKRIRELTPRNWGSPLKRCISRVNVYLRGWYGFFGICSEGVEYALRGLDAHIRRRLRAIKLKQWKCKRTIARKLIRLGVKRKTAWRRVYAGRKSLWALSHDPAVERGLQNAYFAARGLVSLVGLHRGTQQNIVVQGQLMLFKTS